jgi:hypothetical protein
MKNTQEGTQYIMPQDEVRVSLQASLYHTLSHAHELLPPYFYCCMIFFSAFRS